MTLPVRMYDSLPTAHTRPTYRPDTDRLRAAALRKRAAPPFLSRLSRLAYTFGVVLCAGSFALTCAGAHAQARAKTVAQAEFEEEVVPQRYAANPDVDAFINDVVARDGFDRAELQRVFSRVVFSQTAARLAAPPATPGQKNWARYERNFLDNTRINGGVRFWNQNAAALSRAAKQYGVPEEIIVAIIGVETIYGRHMGNFRTIDALTTLAFDYPPARNRSERMALFRNELENLLLYARERGVDPFSIYGSYAGAIGIPQFMPSSIRNYAVDYTGDGKINLTNDVADAIGSVANFLTLHGWQAKQPIVWNIAGDRGSQGLAEAGADGQPEPHWKLGDFIKAGMLMNEPRLDVGASLDTPVLIVDLPTPGQATQYRMGLTNFYVLTRYNRSFFYAMTVYDLADAIKAARAP
ncbi:lytic murein transglycosylase B [Pandoraea terrigena]|uniref:Membrane-bound lytic murein transglycosylase B n=1 Tax=Pandoraea terrigena TaxID=2508292 RepID=A0A5E4YH31_9BURK|nr:lytic murein transglycosylase B [Pandoraea terrigena]VVE48136.1 Membrane-bound lytic murein transglycosylase B [Pandoraea terrigena]